MPQMPKDKVLKFFLAYIFLLFLIPFSLISVTGINKIGETRSRATNASANIYFWPSSADLKINQDFTIQVHMESPRVLKYADLVLSFNPNVVEVRGIAPGSVFTGYTGRLIDNQQGLVGLGGRGEWQKSGLFAQFTIFTKSSGNPDFKFNYLNLDGVPIDAQAPKYEVQ